MKRSVPLSQLLGFAISSFLGTLLHFLYEWSNESPLAALISGVNESTWEHMKLLFFPTFAFAIVQSFFFKAREDFWCVKLRGIITGIVLIPLIFYTYNGVIGVSPAWLNIAIFFISALIEYAYETLLFNKNTTKGCNGKLAFFVLCAVAALFMVFTFFTPELAIFKDPVTGTYGNRVGG